jgi:hypothetical protein
MGSPSISITIGQVIPGAPLGILGGFIEKKLREYVEPERAGTPKGEPVGLSHKKFYAVLLNLTCVDLRKVAKRVGVSYGVLRKWRTEQVFEDRTTQLRDEFIKDPFFGAAYASLAIWRDSAILKAENGIEAESILSEKLVGFEDASLYAPWLVNFMLDEWQKQVMAFCSAPNIYIDEVLVHITPLVRLLRATPQDADHWRHIFVCRLTDLQRQIIRGRVTNRQLFILDTIAEFISHTLKN